MELANFTWLLAQIFIWLIPFFRPSLHWQVSIVKILPELPRTATNKLLRRVLKDRLKKELSLQSRIWSHKLMIASDADDSCKFLIL